MFNHFKEIVNKDLKLLAQVKDTVVLKNNKQKEIQIQEILIIHNKDMNRFYKIYKV